MIKILLGLAILLIGISMMSNGLKELVNPIDAIDNKFGMFIAALTGTLIWQSSSITTVLLLTVVGGGAVTLSAGIAGMIGANIGTCITALIAAVGTQSSDALRLAVFHLLFNIGAAAIFWPFIDWIAEILKNVF